MSWLDRWIEVLFGASECEYLRRLGRQLPLHLSEHVVVAVICPSCKRSMAARRSCAEAWCRHCGHKWNWEKARLVRAGRRSA